MKVRDLAQVTEGFQQNSRDRASAVGLASNSSDDLLGSIRHAAVAILRPVLREWNFNSWWTEVELTGMDCRGARTGWRYRYILKMGFSRQL